MCNLNQLIDWQKSKKNILPIFHYLDTDNRHLPSEFPVPVPLTKVFTLNW